MAFSRESFNAIWKRAGGRKAGCCTCGRSYLNGWNLDCSHLDHSRNATYDHPARGILECLDCHFSRHVQMYFGEALKYNKWKMRIARFICEAIGFRILHGERKRDSSDVLRPKKLIKAMKKHLKVLVKRHLKSLVRQAAKLGESKSDIKRAVDKMNELIYLMC